MNELPLYQINAVMAILLTLSMTALFILMLILWPKTLLNKLALWFMFWTSAVMWRYIGGVLLPSIFNIMVSPCKESLIASVIFGIAAITTVAFALVAWTQHVRESRK